VDAHVVDIPVVGDHAVSLEDHLAHAIHGAGAPRPTRADGDGDLNAGREVVGLFGGDLPAGRALPRNVSSIAEDALGSSELTGAVSDLRRARPPGFRGRWWGAVGKVVTVVVQENSRVRSSGGSRISPITQLTVVKS
jgi:hypothetical protein